MKLLRGNAVCPPAVEPKAKPAFHSMILDDCYGMILEGQVRDLRPMKGLSVFTLTLSSFVLTLTRVSDRNISSRDFPLNINVSSDDDHDEYGVSTEL